MKDEYIGIGKVNLPSKYKLPSLHVLFHIDDAPLYPYNAICLEYDCLASGKDAKEALDHLYSMLIEYVEATLKQLPPQTLSQIAIKNSTNKEWEIYKKLSFKTIERDNDYR